MAKRWRAAAICSVLSVALVGACSSSSTNETSGGGGGGATGGASGASASGGTGGASGSATGGAGGSGAAGGTGGASGSGGTGASGGAAGSAGASGTGGSAGTPSCALSADAGGGQWPDSSTQFCAGSACDGQDGDYQINVPVYSVSGSEVSDPVTGLTWQKGFSNGLQYGEADTACSTLGMDWRLPTLRELVSIIDYGDYNPALPPEFDPPGLSSTFWTASAGQLNATRFIVNAQGGATSSLPSISLANARCVKGTLSGGAAADAGCDVVVDSTTGLIWQRTPEAQGYTWADAIKQCEGLSHAGFDDWRLPNAKELATIVRTNTSPSVDGVQFPNTPKAHFWTSSPFVNNQNQAWAINFDIGWTVSDQVTTLNRVRCVRSQ